MSIAERYVPSESEKAHEPTLGRLSAQKLEHMREDELASLLVDYGVDTIFQHRGYQTALNNAALGKYWDVERCLRIALLYLDGRGIHEIADAFGEFGDGHYMPTEDDIHQTAKRFLSKKVLEQGAMNRAKRKWQELTRPEDPRLESKLQDLEKVAGIPREIFLAHPSGARGTTTERKGYIRRAQATSSPRVVIHILHLKYHDKESTETVARRASLLVDSHGNKEEITQGDVRGVIFRFLSDEGKRAFGIRGHAL